jgi:hypothetical protein
MKNPFACCALALHCPATAVRGFIFYGFLQRSSASSPSGLACLTSLSDDPMRLKILTAAAALACSPLYAQTTPTLGTVTVTATSLLVPLGASSVEVSAPGMLRPGQDTASFLNDIPGASVPVGVAIPAMGRNVTLAL